jgi:hypothetical protein
LKASFGVLISGAYSPQQGFSHVPEFASPPFCGEIACEIAIEIATRLDDAANNSSEWKKIREGDARKLRQLGNHLSGHVHARF